LAGPPFFGLFTEFRGLPAASREIEWTFFLQKRRKNAPPAWANDALVFPPCPFDFTLGRDQTLGGGFKGKGEN
jgi:hypothetical protein